MRESQTTINGINYRYAVIGIIVFISIFASGTSSMNQQEATITIP